MEIKDCIKTELLIENHIHGAFGVDFNHANVEEILDCSKKLLRHGIGGYFPTLATDTVENLKHQIAVIKQAKSLIKDDMAEILGVHLEGNFMNPLKRGIQDEKLFMPLTNENYKQIEDEIIKIVTLAPELDEGLIEYLRKNNVKVQAGHCIGGDLKNIDGVTHLFNAMSAINHRTSSTSLTAILDDKIYTEVIMDLVHLSKDILKFVFKTKPEDKILLISDCLPIAYSDLEKMEFCNKTVYYDGEKITSKDGTLAGSSLLLDGILKKLYDNDIDAIKFIKNTGLYHGIKLDGNVYWNDDMEIVAVEKGDVVLYKE